MEKGQLLYEGKAKQIFATNDPEVLWVSYKDSATAFNGEKKETIAGKGVLNNQISAAIFNHLKDAGIPNHLIETLSDTEQLVQRVQIVPLEVVVRNVYAGSLSRRLGVVDGTPLPRPIIELYYKDDALGDPIINDEHVAILALATPQQLAEIKDSALKVNTALQTLFDGVGVTLVDFKLEYGITTSGEILLADEVSPDTCRLWDKATGARLDKDVFRLNIGNITEVYTEIYNRLGGSPCSK
ncbi:MAG: phosphoribosylaminoimidazolesuccinocarboxamide synthase [Bacilli bacterium]